MKKTWLPIPLRGVHYDDEIIELAKKYIRPGTAMLDVGANYGQMSVVLSKHMEASGGGKVYAFEAEPFVGEVLKKNVAINNRNNIEIVMGAVHFQSGIKLIFPEPDFKRFDSYGSYGIDPQATKGREVETLTIDSLGITEKVSFIKVDIQGSDLFALQGAKETILRDKPVIIFEFEEQFQDEFKTCFNDYVEFVRSVNYKFTNIISHVNYLIVPND
ncbi:MAG: FkbM family methyltransferase [Chitinophagaceae bacterium]|nr:FkbM family methyltransferase [Chitinophagaceae bacterium]